MLSAFGHGKEQMIPRHILAFTGVHPPALRGLLTSMTTRYGRDSLQLAQIFNSIIIDGTCELDSIEITKDKYDISGILSSTDDDCGEGNPVNMAK
jgi:hypothetical protein